MPDFCQLIPTVPPDLSGEEAASYQQRRQHCLELLAAQAAENPDYEPDAYHLTLYCAEVTGRLSSQAIMEALLDHYAQLQAGTRQWLPSDRLDDPRRDYHQPGEHHAADLIGAVYDAWRAAYVATPPPVYGPHLPGQEPVPTVKPALTRAERHALIAEVWKQVRTQLPPPYVAAAIGAEPAQPLGLFEWEVLSSYLAWEVNSYQARQLLATHGASPQHRFRH